MEAWDWKARLEGWEVCCPPQDGDTVRGDREVGWHPLGPGTVSRQERC